MDVLMAILTVLVATFVYLIYRAWKINQHWQEKGVPYIKPMLIIGNNSPLIFGQSTVGQLYKNVSDLFPNEPFIGFYDFLNPSLLIKDVELIEKIFIKDFNHFVDHGIDVDEGRNPLHSNLFNMTGKRWKACRNKLSPIFTTGKMRSMFETMQQCGNDFIDIVDKEVDKDIDMRELLTGYVMDNIGSCAFGINPQSLTNPNCEFRKMGIKMLDLNFFEFLNVIIVKNFPSLAKILNLTFNKAECINYYAKVIKDILKYRRDNNVKRNDFVQLMLQLQDKGYVEVHTKDADDDYLNINETSYSTEKFELTDDQIVGNAVTFLAAGFDAVTTTLSFLMYEITKQNAVQKKMREEIMKKVHQHGELSYNAVREMIYMEQCIKETLRMYPVAQMLLRICTKDYVLPNGLKIYPGQSIIVPALVVHQDPKYYPEPEKFKPERFAPDNEIPSCAFLPFGNGPRICIGMRFAMLQMKYCLAKLLMNYDLKLSPKTKEPLTISNRSLITKPNETLYFNIKRINY